MEVYIKEVYSLLRGGEAENIAIFVTNIEIMKIFSFEKKISIRRTSYQLRLNEALKSTCIRMLEFVLVVIHLECGYNSKEDIH